MRNKSSGEEEAACESLYVHQKQHLFCWLIYFHFLEKHELIGRSTPRLRFTYKANPNTWSQLCLETLISNKWRDSRIKSSSENEEHNSSSTWQISSRCRYPVCWEEHRGHSVAAVPLPAVCLPCSRGPRGLRGPAPHSLKDYMRAIRDWRLHCAPPSPLVVLFNLCHSI